MFNQGPLFIGGVPWMRDECSLNMLIDKFSFYNKELKAFEIQAQSQPSLGMVEGSSLHLGCIACTKE